MRQRGAILVESTILLPLLVLGIFFFVWIGWIFNSKSALTGAVSRSVRLAITRGDPNVARQPVILEIDDYVENGAVWGRTPDFLSKEVDFTVAQQYYSQHSLKVFQDRFGVPTLQDVPHAYTYALLYAYEYLKAGIGPSIRYPCNPEETNSSADPALGAGCISCVFLNPLTIDDQQFSGGAVPEDVLAMECKYQPSAFLVTPILNMLSTITGGDARAGRVVITRRTVVER